MMFVFLSGFFAFSKFLFERQERQREFWPLVNSSNVHNNGTWSWNSHLPHGERDPCAWAVTCSLLWCIFLETGIGSRLDLNISTLTFCPSTVLTATPNFHLKISFFKAERYYAFSLSLCLCVSLSLPHIFFSDLSADRNWHVFNALDVLTLQWVSLQISS